MNARSVILVADDEAAHRMLLRDALESAGFDVLSCANGEETLQRLEDCALMLLDVRMPGMSGLEVLRVARERRPELPVILLTAYIDVRDAVQAMKNGAWDYLEKPVDLDELVTVVEDALGLNRGEESAEALPPGVVAESGAMRELFGQARKVAATDTTVLILGESGVGKEVVARYIHGASARADKPLITLDCSALPEHLVEAELFGHERGAFTGADTARPGRFFQADGGTLFLDEVGEMPLALQPKLLRALETGVVRPVGAARETPVDVRTLVATNRNLEQEVAAGRFREDLFYRINVFPLLVPPLRDRVEDIPELAARFLKETRKQLSPAAERLLLAHSWPGNVRELRNALERAAILADGARILPEMLPSALRGASTDKGAGSVLIGDMAAIERRAIREALKKTGGNKTQAAKLLGISRRNLLYKVRAYADTDEEAS